MEKGILLTPILFEAILLNAAFSVCYQTVIEISLCLRQDFTHFSLGNNYLQIVVTVINDLKMKTLQFGR